MQRVQVDAAVPAVKDFILSLPLDRGDIELELNGEVVCRVINAAKATEKEKAGIVAEGWELVRRARERNRDVPAKVIEREVNEAIAEVRSRRQ